MASAIKDFTKAIELNPISTYYAGRGFAYAAAEASDEALNDFARAIELDPRGATAYAYRAWTYLHQQQAELGLKEVARALKLDANCAVAYWVRGEIHEAQGRAELAVADLRQALALDSNLNAASRTLERLGITDRPQQREVAEAAREGWRVYQKGKQFVARNEDYPRLQIELEMLGKGQPRILEWEVKKPPFQGIAILRFYAGSLDNPRGPEEVEYAAIVDLQANQVVAIEMQRLGAKVATGLGTKARSSSPMPMASPMSSSCGRPNCPWPRPPSAPSIPGAGARISAHANPSRCSTCCSNSSAVRAHWTGQARRRRAPLAAGCAQLADPQ